MVRAARYVLSSLLSFGAGAALADPPAPVTLNPPPPAAAAATASPGANLAPAKAGPMNDDQKVVCKYEIPVGSRLGGHKTCMTKADWDLQSRENSEAMSHRVSSSWNANH